jgi:hypothetical protein
MPRMARRGDVSAGARQGMTRDNQGEGNKCRGKAWQGKCRSKARRGMCIVKPCHVPSLEMERQVPNQGNATQLNCRGKGMKDKCHGQARQVPM